MKYIKILFLLSLIWANFEPKIGSHPIFQMANASNFNAIYDFRLKLDEAVPFRVYSFNHPNRIVLELHTSAIKGLENLEVTSSPLLGEIKFSKGLDGWSTISIELAKPAKVQNLTMEQHKLHGLDAELSFALVPIEQEEFNKMVRVFADDRFDTLPIGVKNEDFENTNNNLTVVIDPGHGGLDPGAQVESIRESDLMLTLARVVAEEINALDNTTVILTRTTDEFTSLDKRLTLAVQVGADLFISLHADTVKKGKASGSTVYTLSNEASDKASARLAARHGGNELISGLDLSGAETAVTSALMGLLRRENTVRSNTFSKSIIKNLETFDIKLNPKPSRKANFSVLKLPSVPSILIETGFMSTSSDLKNLQDQDWAEKFALAISSGILEWIEEDQLFAKNRME